MTEPTLSFEKAFERLEQILETMNSGKIALEDSLKLFEEAEKLMRYCNKSINAAEGKIEALIKGREGELALNEEGIPLKQDFGSEKKEELPF